MPLISLVVVLVVIGVILYLVNTLIPIDPKIKQIINVVVILVICVWLLQIFLGPELGDIRIGRGR